MASINMHSMNQQEPEERSKLGNLRSALTNPPSLKITILKKLASLDDKELGNFKHLTVELIEPIFEYRELQKLNIIFKKFASNKLYNPSLLLIMDLCLQEKYYKGSTQFDEEDLITLFMICIRKQLGFAAAVILNHFTQHCLNDIPNEHLSFILNLISLINLTKITKLLLDPCIRSFLSGQEKELYENLESFPVDTSQITPDTCHNFYNNVFHMAIMLKADIETLAMLLKKGVKIDECDKYGYNVFHYLFVQRVKADSVFNWLLEKGIDTNVTVNSLHALTEALLAQNLYAAEKIFKKIPVTQRSLQCSLVLDQLCKRKPDNHFFGIQFLLSHKIPLGNEAIKSALKHFNNHPEIFYLIASQKNLKSNFLNYEKLCSLAKSPPKQACLKEIIIHNPHLIKDKDQRDYSFLEAACKAHSHRKNTSNIIGFILDQEGFVDQRKPDGTTPLMTACQEGKLEVVEILLAYKANPKASKYATLDDAPNPSILDIATANRGKDADYEKIYQLILRAVTKNSFSGKVIKYFN